MAEARAPHAHGTGRWGEGRLENGVKEKHGAHWSRVIEKECLGTCPKNRVLMDSPQNRPSLRLYLAPPKQRTDLVRSPFLQFYN